jgi:transcriptional regulator with XRE-family HTH domain
VTIVHDDFQTNFSSRLIKLRMAKGVSAREMSLSMGQSEGYVAQIERKHNLPSMMVFSFMCEYLGISPKDFFDDEQENPELLQVLIKKMKSFNQEELESVMSVVDIIGKKKT